MSASYVVRGGADAPYRSPDDAILSLRVPCAGGAVGPASTTSGL
jgi:hypothetical protein